MAYPKALNSEIVPSEFNFDERVQAHPACDCWMMGDRYGTVVNIGHKFVWVKMDVSGKIRKFNPDNLLHM